MTCAMRGKPPCHGGRGRAAPCTCLTPPYPAHCTTFACPAASRFRAPPTPPTQPRASAASIQLCVCCYSRYCEWRRTGSSTMQEVCSPARCGVELELDICGKLGVAAAAADARQDRRLQRCSCRGATVQLTFPRQQRTILLPRTGAWSRMGSRPSAPAPWIRPSQTRWTCWAAATVSPITYSTASSQTCMVSARRDAGPQRRCVLPQQGIMLLPVSVPHVAPGCSDALLFPRSTHG